MPKGIFPSFLVNNQDFVIVLPVFPRTVSTLYTKGVPLMFNRIAITVTTSADTVEFVVPANERWVVLGIWMLNCTLSSGNSVMSAQLNDQNGSRVGYFFYVDATTLAELCFPSGYSSQAYWDILPFVVYEKQSLKLTWGADANKSGSGYYYLNVLQFGGEKYT